MPSAWLLWLAALVLVVIGVAHSYLGEKYVFGRLFALPNLLRRDPDYTRAVIRFAWHITSIAWWGFAAVLVILAVRPPGDARAIGAALAATFLVSGLVIVLTAGRRHPAWPLLFIAAVATLLGTW
jgi:hypothetical protein